MSEPNNKLDDITEDDELDELRLIDLDGETYEIIDTVSLDGKSYVALIPYKEEESEDDSATLEFTILEITDDPDDEENCILKTVDDDELYERIGDAFIEQFGSYDEEE